MDSLKREIITGRKRSLGLGNIFRSVCQSFCPQGEVLWCHFLLWTASPRKAPPPGQYHKRSVHILLECFLVNNVTSQKTIAFFSFLSIMELCVWKVYYMYQIRPWGMWQVEPAQLIMQLAPSRLINVASGFTGTNLSDAESWNARR